LRAPPCPHSPVAAYPRPLACLGLLYGPNDLQDPVEIEAHPPVVGTGAIATDFRVGAGTALVCDALAIGTGKHVVSGAHLLFGQCLHRGDLLDFHVRRFRGQLREHGRRTRPEQRARRGTWPDSQSVGLGQSQFQGPSHTAALAVGWAGNDRHEHCSGGPLGDLNLRQRKAGDGSLLNRRKAGDVSLLNRGKRRRGDDGWCPRTARALVRDLAASRQDNGIQRGESKSCAQHDPCHNVLTFKESG